MMRKQRAGLLCTAWVLASMAAAADAPAARPRPQARGAEAFAQQCVACHLADGSGSEGTVPALKGSPIPTGEPATFAKLLLRGPAAVLPPERMRYENDMPSFESLSDEDLAAIMTYVRQTFGKGGPPVTAAQVKAFRK
jgi:mono/diheme cytochrome c family protein